MLIRIASPRQYMHLFLSISVPPSTTYETRNLSSNDLTGRQPGGKSMLSQQLFKAAFGDNSPNQGIYEPRHEEPCFLHMRKQRRKSASNHTADQRLCFRYIDSTSLYFLNPKFQASSHLLWFYSPVLSDLDRNSEDRFAPIRIIMGKTCFFRVDKT